MKRSALGIALCVTAWCSHARADAGADVIDVELSWSAPAGCPQLIEVEAEIVRRLGRPLTTEGPALEADGVIEASERGFVLKLTTELHDESGSRTLEAPRCEELASAAAVIVALLADPHADVTETPAPPPAPPAQPEPKPKSKKEPESAAIEIEDPEAPASRSWNELGISLRPELLADLGTLPAIAIGPGLALGVRFDRTALELFGSYLPPNTASADARALGTLELWSAGAGICHAFGRVPSLSPCLRFEYGRMAGKGGDIRIRDQGTGVFAAVIGGLRLDFPLIRGLGVGVELQVGLPVAHTVFTVEGVGNAHEPSVAIVRTRAGVELQF